VGKFTGQLGSTPKTGKSPIKSTNTITTNHGGALAYASDAKSDLFLLGVMNFVGEDTFYESAKDRDARFEKLVHQVTREDADWVARFIPWLRNEANMRSASIVAAVEYGRAGGENRRAVVASAISRADEPAEVLAYWIGRYGRPIPSWLKRGVNDAMDRTWSEYSVAKYDGNSRTFRMGDVVNLTHPKPSDPSKAALYKYVQDTRFGTEPSLEGLPLLAARRRVNAGEVTRDQLLADTDLMRTAGMTWEALGGLGAMDAKAWEAVIPQMGYMALLRNLRNFEQAGISSASTEFVINKLKDPEQVAKSRQLPFRFWSAYKNTNGLQWAYALEQALDHSLKNLPTLGGRTLLLVDTSDSMNRATFSEKSTMVAAEAAAIFGAALALKGEQVDWYGFANSPFKHEVRKGSSILTAVREFRARSGETGHGTNIPGAFSKWNGHDRVVIISDMQTLAGFEKKRSGYGYYGYGDAPTDARACGIPKHVPVFGFNLGGYGSTQIGTDNQFELGGLTDHTFKMMPMLERYKSTDWPF
jgi:hypothetical protein